MEFNQRELIELIKIYTLSKYVGSNEEKDKPFIKIMEAEVKAELKRLKKEIENSNRVEISS